MLRKFLFLIIVLLFGRGDFLLARSGQGERPIVLMVTSYNNSAWYERNLDSVLSQNYSNWKVVYIDDCSPDKTGELVERYICKKGMQGKIILIKNVDRKLKVANFYDGVHQHCRGDEIVIDLDGDDWLAHPDVLSIINRAYDDPNIWMTYGSYVTWPKPTFCYCKPFPEWVIEQNAYRDYQWTTSHIKTFYAWLFKKVEPEHLMIEGNFFDMTGDLAIMFPMLELAGGRCRFISDVLYVYNRANPINDNKVSTARQLFLDRYIRRRLPRYKRID